MAQAGKGEGPRLGPWSRFLLVPLNRLRVFVKYFENNFASRSYGDKNAIIWMAATDGGDAVEYAMECAV